MRWDLYTASAVASGVLILVAAIVVPRFGTAKDRLLCAAVGGGSVWYGLWVGHQRSGVYFFSLAPVGIAIGIAIRAVQRMSGRP